MAGGAGTDTLAGEPGADALNGDTGDDALDGGEGDDRMQCGVGNDRYFVDASGDQVIENAVEAEAGTDDVYARASVALGSGLENLVLQGSADLDGNGGSNVLIRDCGNDELDGGRNADRLKVVRTAVRLSAMGAAG